MNPNRTEILRLYKSLLRYGEVISLTDKSYFKRRIQKEFKENKTASEDITFLYEKSSYGFLLRQNISRGKKSVDKSQVPSLNERDLEEQFVKGSGPGGSKVNKAINAAHLFHKPTGLQVKVHEFRELEKNRKLARQKLIMMLDNLVNGDNSVENQLKQIALQKHKKNLIKKKKLSEKKRIWKESIQELNKLN